MSWSVFDVSVCSSWFNSHQRLWKCPTNQLEIETVFNEVIGGTVTSPVQLHWYQWACHLFFFALFSCFLPSFLLCPLLFSSLFALVSSIHISFYWFPYFCLLSSFLIYSPLLLSCCLFTFSLFSSPLIFFDLLSSCFLSFSPYLLFISFLLPVPLFLTCLLVSWFLVFSSPFTACFLSVYFISSYVSSSKILSLHLLSFPHLPPCILLFLTSSLMFHPLLYLEWRVKWVKCGPQAVLTDVCKVMCVTVCVCVCVCVSELLANHLEKLCPNFVK